VSEPEVIEAEVVEQMERLPAVRQHEAIVARSELSVADVVAQHDKIIEVMQAVMRAGIHYGKIPGVDKPTLLKPGAETINVALRLAPDYDSERHFHDDGHLTVTSKCTLTHITSGLVIAAGEGLCSTRESKYAWRQGLRSCPDCGAAAIVRSTKKSAYFCISNEGGCGHRFNFGGEQAKFLDDQDVSRVPNPDLADQWNTVIKMANKRALIAAVLNGTAASDVFTQDVEDSAVQTAGRASDQTSTGLAARPATGSTPQRRTPPLSSWKDLEAAIREYGGAAWEDWQVFGAQARTYVFGELPLSDFDKDELWRMTARAASTFVERCDPSKFPPPSRGDMRKAWAAALEEVDLEGPAWRMSPDETDREPRPQPEKKEDESDESQ